MPAKTNARTELRDFGGIRARFSGYAQDRCDAAERGRGNLIVEHLHGEGRHAQVGGKAGEEIDVRPCVPMAICMSIQQPR